MSENSNQTCSLPNMIDLDWRMDIKTSSDLISRMAVPTVIFKLNIEDKSQPSGSKTVIFEMNKETINTMLDGLEFVQGQLNSIK
ncbi:hypothetical protein DLAC_08768 [Tieghemostelium lacteum]|uniref:COMM domain-containing protein n=1 Tax=Tieghemostelium lacteum TaxID=361077 RepID=A0A151Z8B3_TIELA|nr:hypothetical protein DLAC_08768 [Tieghemostelium lacteum]|eukprot:KYQ90175.1 hypothetical protein DLAC_08768 [Tieghemostelium lacteum]